MSDLSTFVESLSTVKAPAYFSFKSDKLNRESAIIAEETAKLAAVGENVAAARESFNRAVSPVLARIMEEKSYSADGFKSVADYAEQTFNIKRSMAYMLARVGKRVKSLPELSEFTVSNAAELVNADGIAVRKAIESGELSSDSSQQQLRDFAAKHPVKEAKPKVLHTFDLFDMGGHALSSNVLRDDFASAIGFKYVVKAPIDGESRATYVAYVPTEPARPEFSDACVFYAVPHTSARKSSGANQYAALRKAFPFMKSWTDSKIQTWIDSASANEEDSE